MTAKEFREEQCFKHDHFSKLTQTGISPDYENIEKFAKDYHEAELKKMRGEDCGETLICDCISTIGSFDKNGIYYCKTCNNRKKKQPVH